MTNSELRELIRHHVGINRFGYDDAGAVIIDATGLELTLSEALTHISEHRDEAVATERERCAKLLEDQAELETNSLHCGDNSMTIHSTNRYAADLRRAAKLIRASVSSPVTEKTDG